MDWNNIKEVIDEQCSLEDNKYYLAERTIEIDDKQIVFDYVDKYWSKTKISLDKLRKRLIVDSEYDFYVTKNKSNGLMGLHIAKSNGDRYSGDIVLKCQICNSHFKIKQERKLFYEREHCVCSSCRCKLAQQQDGVKERYEKTMLEKYGCKRPIQNAKIKAKTEKTMLKKYGAKSPLESDIVRKKIANTMIEKYGEDNPFKLEEFQKKADDTMVQKYGSSNIWQTEIGLKIKNSFSNGFSKIANEFFDKLSEHIPYKIMYGTNEKRLVVGDKTFFLDGYIEEININIEFFGNWFHANPEKYSHDMVIGFHKSLNYAWQIWEKDAERKKLIEEEYGIKTIVVWEKEFREDKGLCIKRISKKIEKIKEA